ncbi:Branched-chain amino acid transport system / permease component [Neomoorella glycerini]|uniref:Branched-chain amino acid transport system / permease component n=1 Tax=Neomoorella glycerini TaxID=55779 RepID=A0A6I5ZRB7_9FIRM|nr:ABC transporter permease [Moorella glycerini]QGP92278.1 Branched-chain amino acid transport system / permease component [Moorella glycerini]
MNTRLSAWLKIFNREGWGAILTPILGIIFGFAVAALVIFQQGKDPLAAYKELFLGSFGDLDSFTFTLLRFIPLAFTGLAVTLAYRGGVFNIGAEGQLYVAALASTWVGVSMPGLPVFIHLPLALFAGMVAGALFAFIPGYLKATRNFNEILITILMNYIGINLVGLAVNNFLMEPNQTAPQSSLIARSAWLPFILPGTFLHAGLILVFIFALLIYYILWHTTWGYEIRSVGTNREAARYGGVEVKQVIILVMTASGALASFAGSSEILGVQHRLLENFMVGYGYDAIAVALLGGLHPFGTLLAALFFGALRNGANSMQISAGVPVAIVYIIQALAVLSIIGATAARKVYFQVWFGGKINGSHSGRS